MTNDVKRASTWLDPNRRSFSADRVRTLAIVMVVFCHLRYLNRTPESFATLTFYWNSGVDVFFALSGFLITQKYFQSISNGRNALRFYYKRWRRTLPLYFLVMLFYLAIQYPNLDNVIYYLTFSQNYFSPNSWYISWSLCVEEWFYLVYAPFILLLKRIPKSFPFLFAALALLSVCFRFYKFHFFAESDPTWFRDHFYGLSHLRFDGILIGCFFGNLPKLKRPPLPNLEMLFPMTLILLTYVPYLFVEQASRMEPFSAVFQPTATALLTGLWLWLFWDSKVQFARSFFYLGSCLSYSVYLIHLPIISGVNTFGLNFNTAALSTITVVSLTAALLYFYFERAFLKKRVPI